MALIMMGLSLAGIHWPAALDPALLWLMPLPAIADFVAEHFKLVTYNARRQAILSAIGGIAFGRGLGRYLLEPSDRLFWTVSVTYSLVMVGAVYLSSRRDKQVASNLRLQESDRWWADMQASLDHPDVLIRANAANLVDLDSPLVIPEKNL
jgi:hypothetical protein